MAVALRRAAVMSAIADLQRSAQLTHSSARRGHRLPKGAEQGRAELQLSVQSAD